MTDNDNSDEIERVLLDFIAIERDRLLGYSSGEFHREPRDALVDGMWQLIEAGHDPDEIIFPDDQEKLNLDFSHD